MQDARYPEVPSDFGHWLAGFIDGEASFLLSKQRSAHNWRIQVHVTLRADDRAILDEIQKRTGVGGVRANRRVPSTPNAKPTVTWRVWTKADAFQLVRLLDRFPLRAKKARDYAIWREAVIYWSEVRCLGRGRNDWSVIARLRSELIAGRVYAAGPPPRWERPSRGATLF